MKEIEIDGSTLENLQAAIEKASDFLAKQYQKDLEAFKNEMANHEPKEMRLTDMLYQGKKIAYGGYCAKTLDCEGKNCDLK